MKQTLEQVYTKKEFDIEKYNLEPFVLNRTLSMNTKLINEVNMINQYTFFVDKEIVLALIHYTIPKQVHISWRKFLKRVEEKKHEFNFLLEPIKNFYKWSEKDLLKNLPILLKIFEDKDKLRSYFRFFGVDKKYYKKYDVQFKKEKRWF